MYAVRCNTGHTNGFNVGAVNYKNDSWLMEDTLTPEHDFAAQNGALVIIEVESAEDPRLMPFPVYNPEGETVVEASTPNAMQIRIETLEGELSRLKSEMAQVKTEVASFPPTSDASPPVAPPVTPPAAA